MYIDMCKISMLFMYIYDICVYVMVKFWDGMVVCFYLFCTSPSQSIGTFCHDIVSSRIYLLPLSKLNLLGIKLRRTLEARHPLDVSD